MIGHTALVYGDVFWIQDVFWPQHPRLWDPISKHILNPDFGYIVSWKKGKRCVDFENDGPWCIKGY